MTLQKTSSWYSSVLLSEDFVFDGAATRQVYVCWATLYVYTTYAIKCVVQSSTGACVTDTMYILKKSRKFPVQGVSVAQ